MNNVQMADFIVFVFYLPYYNSWHWSPSWPFSACDMNDAKDDAKPAITFYSIIIFTFNSEEWWH